MVIEIKYETEQKTNSSGEIFIKISKTGKEKIFAVRHVIPDLLSESMIDAIMDDIAVEIKRALRKEH